MNPDLKELIEISTVKGSLTADARNLIYTKAESIGVTKMECDIYIEGFLNSKKEQNKSVNSYRKNWGIWLIFCGILDFIWGLYLASDRYTDEYALIFLISGALFVVFGLVLIGAFSNLSKKNVGVIFLSLGIIGLILGLYLASDEFQAEYAPNFLFPGALFVVFGLHKLEKLIPMFNKIKSIISK